MAKKLPDNDKDVQQAKSAKQSKNMKSTRELIEEYYTSRLNIVMKKEEKMKTLRRRPKSEEGIEVWSSTVMVRFQEDIMNEAENYVEEMKRCREFLRKQPLSDAKIRKIIKEKTYQILIRKCEEFQAERKEALKRKKEEETRKKKEETKPSILSQLGSSIINIISPTKKKSKPNKNDSEESMDWEATEHMSADKKSDTKERRKSKKTPASTSKRIHHKRIFSSDEDSTDTEYVPGRTDRRISDDTYRKQKGDPTHADRELRYRETHPNDTQAPERFQKWKESHPGVHAKTDKERREKASEAKKHPIVKEEPITFPKCKPVETSFRLGNRDQLCRYCHAIHFKNYNKCCGNGAVFIEPFRRLPPPLFGYFHDVHNKMRNEFKNHSLSYNNMFSFASLHYNSQRAAPHGAQVIKSIGPVRHFISEIKPNDPNNPQYGNFYVYTGQEALQKRLNHPYMQNLKKEILQLVGSTMEKVNPYAKSYKRMGELMEKDANPEVLRMMIIDAHQVPKNLRQQQHLKTYKEVKLHEKAEFIAVFFTASAEQHIKHKGLKIYPKKGNSVSLPLYPWMMELNPLCYPIFFPYGDPGFRTGVYPRRHDTDPFYKRLKDAARKNPDAAYWDVKEGYDAVWLKSKRIREEGDPNLDASFQSISPEDNPDYDTELTEHMINEHVHEIENTEIVEFNTPYDATIAHRASTETRRFELPNSGFIEEVNDDHDPDYHEDTQVLEDFDMIEDGETVGETEETADPPIPTEVVDVHGPMRNNAELLENTEPEIFTQKTKQYISLREYILYIFQDRPEFYSRFSCGRKLGQLFLIDLCTRLMRDKSNYQTEHLAQYLSTNKKNLVNHFQNIANKHKAQMTIGCVISLSADVPGSPRYLQKKFEQVVHMSNKMGRPDLFITFTANTAWPDITENLPPGDSWADHPFLVNEVFYLMFQEFMNDVYGKKKGSKYIPGIFNAVLWYVYSVEFQQRGPPHVHMIMSLVNHIVNTRQVDEVCQGQLPIVPDKKDPNYKAIKHLRTCVEKFMIHRPCKGDNNAYCNKNKKDFWKTCGKGYPKEFSDVTLMGDKSYPQLTRPNNNQKCKIRSEKNIVEADNTYVIPHNSFLTTKYNCHINIEVISQISRAQYLFKYVFKGPDRVLVETIASGSGDAASDMTVSDHILIPKSANLPTGVIKQRNSEAERLLSQHNCPLKDQNQRPVVVYNEAHQIEDCKAITPCESAWIVAGHKMNDTSHHVMDLFVHLPGEEPIAMEIGKELETYEAVVKEGEVVSKFMAWMKINSADTKEGALARTLTFDAMPTEFVFEDKARKWRKRERFWGNIMGRIKQVQPRQIELFAIRLLAMNRRGITSFNHLRTVDDTLHDTFVGAAKALRLMNDEEEWNNALIEAAQYENPAMLRRLFASILIFCAPKNPRLLWDAHKNDMFEDVLYWTEERNIAHALYHIDSTLNAHGMHLEDYGLPGIIREHLPPRDDLINDNLSDTLSQKEQQIRANQMQMSLNDEQKEAFNTIIDSINKGSKMNFFLEGSGGSGKTYLYETLYYTLSAMGKKVLCVAHTGIAAMLLPHGMTSHRAFSIPLQIAEKKLVNISLESEEADILRNTSIVLWDEISMSDKRNVEAVAHFMQFLDASGSSVFGGKVFIFGGDWRQTLPIVPNIRDEEVLEYTLKKSKTLWNPDNIKILHLRKNMRAVNDPAFAKDLREIGDGIGGNFINVPKERMKNTEKDLIEELYGNGKIKKSEYTDRCAILSVDNATALEVNEKVLDMLPGEAKEFQSDDQYVEDKDFRPTTTEVYNSLTPSGMPPHILRLKVNAVVILLRNISVRLGLCNGTRMRIKKIGQDIIECTPIVRKSYTPNSIFLSRMKLTSNTIRTQDTCFMRIQFPIRLAYAMTINKSQGQTLERVGLLLRTSVFSHGQLFVALSRAREWKDVFIYNGSQCLGNILRNVVYRNVLEDPLPLLNEPTLTDEAIDKMSRDISGLSVLHSPQTFTSHKYTSIKKAAPPPPKTIIVQEEDDDSIEIHHKEKPKTFLKEKNVQKSSSSRLRTPEKESDSRGKTKTNISRGKRRPLFERTVYSSEEEEEQPKKEVYPEDDRQMLRELQLAMNNRGTDPRVHIESASETYWNLLNHGSDCYANSIVWTILQFPLFQSFERKTDNWNMTQRRMIEKIEALRRTQLRDRPHSTAGIISAAHYAGIDFDNERQHDAQEFWEGIVNALPVSAKNTVTWEQKIIFKCETCKQETITIEPITTIKPLLQSGEHLGEAVNFMVQPIVDDQRCEHCEAHKRGNAKKIFTPYQDLEAMVVEVPMMVDGERRNMEFKGDMNNMEMLGGRWELQVAIEHRGYRSLNLGHYVTWCRNINERDEINWVLLNDLDEEHGYKPRMFHSLPRNNRNLRLLFFKKL